MADDYSPLAYTMAGRRSNKYDRSRAFAQQMMQTGADFSPVEHPLQGAARLAQALVGGWMASRADKNEKDAEVARGAEIDRISKLPVEEQLAAYTKLDPEAGLRFGTQLAAKKAELAQQTQGLRDLASTYRPQQPATTGNVQTAQLPPPGQDPSATAISGIESGGRYDAVGPVANKQGDRAYGKFQVMGANVGPWTQEVLGKALSPQEFLQNPQAQEAVFKAKFGQYVQKYGSQEAAARAWFAGEGGMNNPNARDVNGMSVAQYGQKFQAGMPAQGSGDGAPPAVQPPAGMPSVVAPPQPPQHLSFRDAPREFQAPFLERLERGGYGLNRAEAEAKMLAHGQQELERTFNNDKLIYDQRVREADYSRKQADEKPKQVFEQEGKMRDDFGRDAAVKSYRTVVPILESAKDAQARPTRAADLNLIYAFAKLMDPDSVVRESETGAVVATQSVADRLQAYIGQLNGQAMLNPEARAKLIAELDSRFNAVKGQHDALAEQYATMAKSYGLNPERIILNVPTGRKSGPSGNEPSQDELKRWSQGGQTGGQTPVYDMSGKRIR